MATSPLTSSVAGVALSLKWRRSVTVLRSLPSPCVASPRLAAVALDHRTDDRLRGRQAGGDAALGLAQAALALGDDAADGLQGEAQGDDDAGERRRLAEKGKAPDGHGCAFLTGLAATCGMARRIGPGSEENTKATWPGGPGGEATVKVAGPPAPESRSPELASRQPVHRGSPRRRLSYRRTCINLFSPS